MRVANICLLDEAFLEKFFNAAEDADKKNILMTLREAVNEDDKKTISELKRSCGGSFAKVFPSKSGYFAARAIKGAIVKNILEGGNKEPDYDISRYLIHSGCNGYYPDEYGNSALHYLVLDPSITGKANGVIDEIIALNTALGEKFHQDLQAQISQKNNLGLYPEAIAMLSNNLELAIKINEFTKRSQVSIDYSLISFLRNATHQRPENHEEMLLNFLSEKSPEDLEKIFLMAVSSGDANMAEYFLDKVNVENMVVREGRTTLMCIAASNNDVAMLDLLHRSGANHNIADARKLTPMHHVISSSRRRHGDVAALETLFSYGANPYLIDRADKTPLDLAIELRDFASAKNIASATKNGGAGVSCSQESLEDLIEMVKNKIEEFGESEELKELQAYLEENIDISGVSVTPSPPPLLDLESEEVSSRRQSPVEIDRFSRRHSPVELTPSPSIQFQGRQSSAEVADRPETPIPQARYGTPISMDSSLDAKVIHRPVARGARQLARQGGVEEACRK